MARLEVQVLCACVGSATSLLRHTSIQKDKVSATAQAVNCRAGGAQKRDVALRCCLSAAGDVALRCCLSAAGVGERIETCPVPPLSPQESSQLGVQVMRVFFFVSVVKIIGAPQSGPPRPLAAAGDTSRFGRHIKIWETHQDLGGCAVSREGRTLTRMRRSVAHGRGACQAVFASSAPLIALGSARLALLRSGAPRPLLHSEQSLVQSRR